MAESVKPYSEEGSKKGQVSKMFNSIAPYYDFLNHLLSGGIDIIWRKKAISLLKESKPSSILDVATGTADLAITAHKILQPEKITGVDISTKMLEVGRRKIKKKRLSDTITLEEGSAENLPYEDNTFDAITVAFGVRNFEDLNKGLAEMYRVLKEDGSLVVLEFSKPKVFPLKQLFNIYFKYMLPVIGRLTSKDPKAYQYLYDSVQAFPAGDDFLNLLSNNGYKSNKCTPLTFGICSIYHGKKQA
jgi:demethylmenaquinone methyltransferase/2-methoxy-6-polyprenyl-1,4-benzoquinol methylase